MYTDWKPFTKATRALEPLPQGELGILNCGCQLPYVIRMRDACGDLYRMKEYELIEHIGVSDYLSAGKRYAD